MRPSRNFIVDWMEHNLRAACNPLVEAAIRAGNKVGKPVVVVHCISNLYPFPSQRFHKFLLEASLSIETECQERGLTFVRAIVNSETDYKEVFSTITNNAFSVYADFIPLTLILGLTDDRLWGPEKKHRNGMRCFPVRDF